MRLGYLAAVVLSGLALAGCDKAAPPQEVPASTSAATSSPTVTVDAAAAQAACPKHGGRWDPAEGCVIDETTPQATQRLLIPVQWDSSFPELQKAVDDEVADIRAAFRKSVERAGTPPDGKPWALQVTFDAYQGRGVHPTDGVRFSISESLGGYHPGFAFRTLSFDRVTKASLTVSSLLIDPAVALPKISALVRDDLRKQLGGVGTEFVDNGTTPEAGNFANFAFDNDMLVFWFAPYTVAAYAEGPMESRVPLAQLREVLKPEYLAA